MLRALGFLWWTATDLYASVVAMMWLDGWADNVAAGITSMAALRIMIRLERL